MSRYTLVATRHTSLWVRAFEFAIPPALSRIVREHIFTGVAVRYFSLNFRMIHTMHVRLGTLTTSVI